MERIDGAITLRAANPKSLTINECLKLFEMLAILHENGIAHGDLKPENIIAIDDGSINRSFRFIDFGAAALINEPAQAADYVTTAGYSPVEKRENGTTKESDVFALANIVFQSNALRAELRTDDSNLYQQFLAAARAVELRQEMDGKVERIEQLMESIALRERIDPKATELERQTELVELVKLKESVRRLEEELSFLRLAVYIPNPITETAQQIVDILKKLKNSEPEYSDNDNPTGTFSGTRMYIPLAQPATLFYPKWIAENLNALRFWEIVASPLWEEAVLFTLLVNPNTVVSGNIREAFRDAGTRFRFAASFFWKTGSIQNAVRHFCCRRNYCLCRNRFRFFQCDTAVANGNLFEPRDHTCCHQLASHQSAQCALH